MSNRPAIQLWLPLHIEGTVFSGEPIANGPSEDEQWMFASIQLLRFAGSAHTVHQKIISTEPKPVGLGSGHEK
jgi:hypothetical protein